MLLVQKVVISEVIGVDFTFTEPPSKCYKLFTVQLEMQFNAWTLQPIEIPSEISF